MRRSILPFTVEVSSLGMTRPDQPVPMLPAAVPVEIALSNWNRQSPPFASSYGACMDEPARRARCGNRAGRIG